MNVSDIAERIEPLILDAKAELAIAKYYTRGKYTGSWFDSPELASDPNQLEMADFVALATLSVELTGTTVVGLLEQRSTIETLLRRLPAEANLVDIDEADLAPLWELQERLNEIPGIGPVRRSKLLAHKRPNLVPIRDQHVLAAMGLNENSDLTLPLREALRSRPDLVRRLQQLAELSDGRTVTPLRALDVVLWMRQHGDSQVSD